MENNMRFLSNTYDHRKPDARMHFTPTFQAWTQGSVAMDAEWQQHLDWINENIIGPPKATEKHTQQQLEDNDLIGIYAEEKSGESHDGQRD